MVDRTGSGGGYPNRSFTENQKNEIKKIIDSYCDKKTADTFINEFSVGLNEYHFFIEMQDQKRVKTNKEERGQVKALQKTIGKLSAQLDGMTHQNETLIEQFYYFRKRHHIPLTYNGYRWAESLQLLVQDISIASQNYLDDTKPPIRPPSWGTEHMLVSALFQAIIKSKIPITIEDGTDSVAAQLIDLLIKWFNIKSLHVKKRDNAASDPVDSPTPQASGRSIVRAWLRRKDNR